MQETLARPENLSIVGIAPKDASQSRCPHQFIWSHYVVVVCRFLLPLCFLHLVFDFFGFFVFVSFFDFWGSAKLSGDHEEPHPATNGGNHKDAGAIAIGKCILRE